MATRMQQRRGTAAQWISTNAGLGPVLNSGEIGWESDTNKFKIGDGVNNWANLDYFADTNSNINPSFATSIVFEGATADSYETTLQVTDPTADRTITLPNATGTVITTGNLSDITNIGVFTSTITMEGATADAFELTLSAGDPTVDRTITFPDSDGTVATQEYVDDAVSNASVDQSTLAGSGITWNVGTDQFDVDTTTIQARVADVSDTEIGYLNGVTSAIQTQLDAKAPSSTAATLTGTQTLSNKTLSSPTITIGSTTYLTPNTNIDTNNGPYHITFKTVTTSTANQYVGQTFVVTGTAFAGSYVVSSSSYSYGRLFLNFSNWTYSENDDITDFTGITLGFGSSTTVSSTEIGYLDGVTSAIQTQINAKAASADIAELAQDAVGSILGTGLSYNDSGPGIGINNAALSNYLLEGVSGSSYGLIGTSTYLDIKDTNGYNKEIELDIAAVETKLETDGFAKLASPTFTGTVTLPGAPTSDLHAATKQYVDNVTAGINFHEAVHAATTTNLATNYSNGTSGVGATLTADTNRAFSTLDGESVALGQRVLIKNQTDQKQNGIYTLTTVGSGSIPWVLTRATDADNNPTGEMKTGDFVFVQNGTTNASLGFVNNSTASPIVIGTDNITYVEFNAAKTIIAGNGLTEATPGVISIDTTITQARVSGVSDTEIGYLDGVTSAIQTQIDTKLASATAATTYAPIASPTFTGTVTIPNGAALGTPTSATLTNATGLPVSTGLSGLGTGVATFLETPSSSNLAAAVTGETGTGGLVFATAPTLTNAVAVNPIFQAPEERWSISATAATGTIPFDVLTSGILYYTSNASANWTLNVRGSSGATLNDTLATNDSITVVFFVTNGSTAYYQTGFQIDGSAVTPKWQNGTAPSAGNINSIDIYSYTIVKTGNAAFTAFGSQTKFA